MKSLNSAKVLGVRRMRPFLAPNVSASEPAYLKYREGQPLEVNWVSEDTAYVRDYDEHSRVRSTVPMLLLRRHFQREHPSTWTDYHYVFCDFNYTLAASKQGLLSYRSLHEDLDAERFVIDGCLHGVPLEAARAALAGESDFHAVRALLYRLSLAHKALRTYVDKPRARWVAFNIQLFIDTHIDFSNYIHAYRTFKDPALLSEDTNLLVYQKSALDQFYPEASRVSYCGDLPNCVPILEVSNIWYAIRPQFSSILSALIHICGCKTQDHKCQVRNFPSIVIKYMDEFPQLVGLFRRFMEVSFLGNYPHAVYRPCYLRRMQVRWQFGHHQLNDERLKTWMRKNQVLCYFMTKEYYMYLVRSHLPLDTLLDETSHWKESKKAIVAAMDSVRSMFCRTRFHDLQFFEGVERELDTLHDREILPHITKLRKDNFATVMLANMNKYHESCVVDKMKACSQLSEQYLSAEVLKAIEMVCAYLSKRGEERLKTVYLKAFGISEEGYNQFRDLYFMYEKKDIADNAIRKHVIAIYENHSPDHRDFHILRVFLKTLRQRNSFRLYPLSADLLQNQVRALRARLSLMPWEPLPPNADIFWLCTNCGNWAHSVMDMDLEQKKYTDPVKGPARVLEARDNVYSTGCEQALHDFTTGKLYCGRASTSTNAKKLAEKGEQEWEGDDEDEDEIREWLKTAKTLRKYHETDSCTDTELTPIHMLGNVVEFGGKMSALCETCAWLTQYDGTKFNPMGYTCSVHRREEAYLSEVSLVRAAKVEELSADLDKPIHPNADELTELRRRRGLIDLGEKKRCTYCNGTPDKKGALSEIKLIDDTPDGGMKLISIQLCEVDKNYGWKALQTDWVAYPRKTVLWKQIADSHVYEMIHHAARAARKNDV